MKFCLNLVEMVVKMINIKFFCWQISTVDADECNWKCVLLSMDDKLVFQYLIRLGTLERFINKW